MITKLLLGGSVLLLFSCSNTSDQNSTRPLSDDEMKSLVEVEEIEFDNDGLKDAKLKDSMIPQLNSKVSLTPQVEEINEEAIETIPEPPLGPRDLCCLGCSVRPKSDTNQFGAYFFPEVSAEYPGGIQAMKTFIASNMKYPDVHCFYGRIYVSFIVEKDGSLTHAEVMRGGLSKEHNEEALRIVRSMPKWIPAKNNGKIVAANVRLPISFELN